MRNVRWAGASSGLMGAAGLLAASAVLAGCGSAAAGGGSAAFGGGGPARTSQAQAGPTSGSRTAALREARKLLSQLVLPPGAKPAQVTSLPSALRQLTPSGAATESVDVHQLFTVPQLFTTVHGFLLAHVPAGTRLMGNGQASGPTGLTAQTVSFVPRVLPGGFYWAQLATTAVPSPGGATLLRADAQVIWLPARSPAEHLDPARFRQVTITARVLNPKLHTVTRVVTAPSVISWLAGLLNELPAAPAITTGCPDITATYRLSFAPAAGRGPATVVTADGCVFDRVTAGGRAQPALLDRPAKLVTAAAHLLHVKPQP